MSSLATLEQVAHGPRNEVTDSSAAPSETEVASLVRELFVRAKEARRGQMTQWKRNYRVLNNRNYVPGSTPWEEDPSVTTIWPVIASSVAWMTDQRPTIEVTPTAEAFTPYWDFYEKLARDMNTCINSGFQNYALDGEIVKSLWDVYTYGIAYYKTQWDATLAEGLGDAVFRRVDPFTVYPDPHANGEAELSYIIEARSMTVADADRAWPGAMKKIGDMMWLEETEAAPHKLDATVQRNQPRAALGALAPNTSNPGYVKEGGRAPRPHDTPVVTVLEAYVRGSLFEKGDQEGVTKVRDDWRCIVVCGNAILMDESCNDVNAFGKQPYTRQVLFDTGEWYGPCIVEFLAPIQRIINWLLGSMNRNIYLMGNPVIVEDPRSASVNKRLTNRPGQRFTANPQQISWMNPPQMHPQLSTDLIQYYKGEIETISGLSAMVRGFAPTGRNAQGVLDSVQDAAFVRVRASLRELERSLRSVASNIVATIAEFYDEPRLISIIGPDGQHTAMSLRARHFYAIDADSPEDRIPLRFSLVADAGSQLPTSKQARAAQAMELFQIGAIDEYEVLKAQGWPSYALVAQRVMERNQQEAMSESSSKK